ncbi:hypothetical protein ABS768_14310 [Flavobacterium sp. ST-75]|uniref:LysE type translocator n=1 Tax=Flavobacterium rhizophilum TaxID=3163296 RepID=A0ABW8YHE4_9FLAO
MYQVLCYSFGAFFLLASGKLILAGIDRNNLRFRSIGVFNLFVSVILLFVGACYLC